MVFSFPYKLYKLIKAVVLASFLYYSYVYLGKNSCCLDDTGMFPQALHLWSVHVGKMFFCWMVGAPSTTYRASPGEGWLMQHKHCG